MGALISPYWHTVADELRGLITALGQQPFLNRFYLAGGTALALQIGHRADRDVQPVLFEEVPWQDVRDFFIQQASHLGRAWLQD